MLIVFLGRKRTQFQYGMSIVLDVPLGRELHLFARLTVSRRTSQTRCSHPNELLCVAKTINIQVLRVLCIKMATFNPVCDHDVRSGGHLPWKYSPLGQSRPELFVKMSKRFVELFHLFHHKRPSSHGQGPPECRQASHTSWGSVTSSAYVIASLGEDV